MCKKNCRPSSERPASFSQIQVPRSQREETWEYVLVIAGSRSQGQARAFGCDLPVTPSLGYCGEGIDVDISFGSRATSKLPAISPFTYI